MGRAGRGSNPHPVPFERGGAKAREGAGGIPFLKGAEGEVITAPPLKSTQRLKGGWGTGEGGQRVLPTPHNHPYGPTKADLSYIYIQIYIYTYIYVV